MVHYIWSYIPDLMLLGYDGGANMRGSLNGVQALITKRQNLCVYVHCWAHSLNLALVNTCKLPIVAKHISLLKEVGNFFVSPKRNQILRLQSQKLKSTKKQTVRAICATRWTALSESTETFLTLLPAIINSLHVIASPNSTFAARSTRTEARHILNNILNFEQILTATVRAPPETTFRVKG